MTRAGQERRKVLPALGLVLVFLTALGLRVAYLGAQLEPGSRERTQGLYLDARLMAETAADIRLGLGSHAEPYQLSPLYPYFLASFPGIEDAGAAGAPQSVRWVQALLGAATAALAAVLATRMGGRRAGLLAGLLAALHGPSVYYEGQLLVAGPQAFLLMLGLVCADAVGRRPDAPRAAWKSSLGGLCLGLAAALRPTVLPLAVGLAAVWLWRASTRRAGAALLVGVGLAVLPFGLRNLLVTGEPVLLSCSGGFNFWVGNHAGAPGIFQAPAGYDLMADPVGRGLAEGATGRTLDFSEASAWWRGQALADLAAEPLGGLARLGRKLLLFFHPAEIPQLGAGYTLERADSWALRWPLNSAWLLLLAALSPWLARRGDAGSRLPAAALWCYALTVCLFFVAGRYRAPILPLAAALAGVTLEGFWRLAREAGRRTTLIAPAVSLVLLAVLGAWVYGSMLPIDPAGAAELQARRRGLELLQAGRPGEAALALQEALEQHENTTTRTALAQALAASGRAQRAASEYRAVLAADPARADAAFGLAGLLLGPLRGSAQAEKLAATREAERLYRTALDLRPGWPEALFNLGAALLNQRRFDEAAQSIEQALEGGEDQDGWRPEALRALEIARREGAR